MWLQMRINAHTGLLPTNCIIGNPQSTGKSNRGKHRNIHKIWGGQHLFYFQKSDVMGWRQFYDWTCVSRRSNLFWRLKFYIILTEPDSTNFMPRRGLNMEKKFVFFFAGCLLACPFSPELSAWAWFDLLSFPIGQYGQHGSPFFQQTQLQESCGFWPYRTVF